MVFIFFTDIYLEGCLRFPKMFLVNELFKQRKCRGNNSYCCCCLVIESCPDSLVTPWTVACQAPLSVGFSRQKYWSGLPFPSPGILSNPGIKPQSSVSPALAGRFFTAEPTGKPLVPWPGIRPGPQALGAWSLNHWTTREVPEIYY